MDTTIDQHVAMDEALIPHAHRLRIGRGKFCLLSDISSKESTLQLVYDVMRLTPFFKAFLVIADVLEIYMHGAIRRLTDVNINKLHQRWRSFAAIINKCLIGKSSGYDSLRLNIKIPRRAMRCIILGSQRHQNTQRFSAMLPIELTNANIRNSDAYKEYYAVATGATPSKTKASQTHISQASGSGADEGTGIIPGVSDVPTEESDEEISWRSNDEGDDDDQKDERDDEDDQEEGSDDEQASDKEEFIHPSLSTHDEEETKDEESFDPIPKTSKNTNDEGNGKKNLEMNVGREEGQDEEDEEDELYRDININLGREETRDEESFDPIPKTLENTDDEGNGEENLEMNVGREKGQDEEDEEDKLYRDVNINLGRGIQMADFHTTQEFEDLHVTLTPTTYQMDVQTPTSVAPLPVSAPIVTPSTITTITTTQQAPTPSTTAPSTLLQDLPNFGSLFGFDHRLKTLEANFYKFMQTNKFARACERLYDEAQAEYDDFLKTIDENMQKIIEEQVKEQVKVQVSKILPKIEQTVNEQLEAEVLTWSTNSSKTSYAIAADLSEMELKKILLENIEGNKSIHRSNEQRNLYKALVEAYESDKIILDTYGDTVMLKRRHDDNADKDEEPSAGSDRGSKRRREGKEPKSASAPKEKATRSASKLTQGSKSRQTSASQSAIATEPMQTTHEMEEPSHPEFEIDHDWNKTLSATQGSIQPWISDLAKQTDSRSSFNELMDTHVEFSALLMNRLKVDTLTPKLLVGPTYELMKGSCKSLVELIFFLEEVYKATTDQLDCVNPEDNVDSRTGRLRQACSLRIIDVTELKIFKWHNYKHLDWITETDKSDSRRMLCFQRLSSNVYKKHRNPKACGKPSTRCRKLPEEAQPNKAGYVPDSDEIPASDNLEKNDKDSAAAIIQAIDKHIKTKRIMRSLKRYKVVRHRYSNLMIQPEPEGSTQGYLLASVEVLRNTKLLSDIEDSHHVPSDAIHNPSQSLKVKKTLFQNSQRYTHFYRLSHSELVGIEKEALSSSLRSLKIKVHYRV
nr:hypothetical protein [Tanacetum cinerariifolium]